MRIGELARRSGVTVRTVRYYVEQELLPPPPLRGKYGEFDESYVQRIQLVQQLKKERLSIPVIRQRLAEMGIMPGGERADGPSPEGLFRSRFAEEAGLTAEQVAQLERLGLIESSEGLLPTDALPEARAIARLLSWGARMEDIAEIVGQVRQEVALHQRLLTRTPDAGSLLRALQWQEQAGAVSTVRQMLLQRWGQSSQGVS